MDSPDDVSSGFSQAILDQLKRRNENASRIVEQRTKAERRADMTEREKGRRRKEPKVQLNMRVTNETFELAHELSGHMDKSIPEMIALALASLAVATPGFKRKAREAQQ